MNATAALWLSVVAIGVYHGLNPAMGWPLAVANGLTAQRPAVVFATWLPLGAGHLLAMAVVLLPFAWLSGYVEWNRPIRLAAGALVMLFGLFKLVRPRHLRALARIRPTQLAGWSFLMATAHGAGLMLMPFMLSLCAAVPETGDAASAIDRGHDTVMATLARANLATAVWVAAVHTLAMVGAGVTMAWAVYRYLGLAFLRRAWFNLDVAWGVSLVAAGVAGIAAAV